MLHTLKARDFGRYRVHMQGGNLLSQGGIVAAADTGHARKPRRLGQGMVALATVHSLPIRH